MIIDKELKLSDQQAVTASAASTNYIDQTAAGDAEKQMYLMVRCHTSAASSNSSATMTISIQTDNNSSFSSPTTLVSSAAMGVSSLVANTYLMKVRLPLGTERYIRVYYTIGTENLTAGKFDAFLAHDIDAR